MAFGVWGFEYHIAAPDGVPFFAFIPVSRRDFSEANNNRNQQKTTKNQPLKANCFSSKNRKEKRKEKKSFTCVFLLLLLLACIFLPFFIFFLRILVWSIMGQRKMNMWILILCITLLTCIHFLTMPRQPWARSTVQAESAMADGLEFWVPSLQVSEWSLKPPCAVAVPGRCFFSFFIIVHAIQYSSWLFSIQRCVWMYVLCCLPGVKSYLFICVVFVTRNRLKL